MIQTYTSLEARAFLAGRFEFTVLEPDGKGGYRVVRKGIAKNANPLAALNHALSAILGAGAQSTTWYLGLINNTPAPTLSPADTAASHAGWSELTSYSEANRPTWTPGAVAGQSITNPSAVTFTQTVTVAIYGAFLISNNTKAGTSGTLWATGAFPQVQNLTSGQLLTVNYTSTAAAA